MHLLEQIQSYRERTSLGWGKFEVTTKFKVIAKVTQCHIKVTHKVTSVVKWDLFRVKVKGQRSWVTSGFLFRVDHFRFLFRVDHFRIFFRVDHFLIFFRVDLFSC